MVEQDQNISPYIEKVQEEECSGDPLPSDEEEVKRLGFYPPFQTLVRLSVGPLMSQIMSSMVGILDSIWVSKAMGTVGLTCLSLVLVVDFINIAFANYFMIASSTKISYLFGKGMAAEAPQVIVDILRSVIVIGVLIPAIFLPLSKPLVSWFEADDEMQEICFQYCIPQLSMAICYYGDMTLCGLCQAEGKSILFGCMQVLSCILNCGFFVPLFLLGLKTPMWGCSLGYMLAYLIPMVILFIMLMCGKFSVKPTWRMFINKFSPHSWSALRIAISGLVSNLATSIPVLLLGNFIAKSSKATNCYDETMAVWNVIDRLYQFSCCVCNALNQGFLPAGSYAYGSNRLHRLLIIALHALWLGTVWLTLTACIFCSLPRQVGSIWGDDPAFLKKCDEMLVIAFCTSPINMPQFLCTAICQSLKKVGLSLIVSVCTMLLPLPIFSCIFYFTDKRNPVRLLFSFVGNDCWSFSVVVIVCCIKLRFLAKAHDESDSPIDAEKVEIDNNESLTSGTGDHEETLNEI